MVVYSIHKLHSFEHECSLRHQNLSMCEFLHTQILGYTKRHMENTAVGVYYCL